MKPALHPFIWGLVALIAISALLAMAGHTFITPESLAGLGMIPVAGSIEDIKAAVSKMTDGIEDFKKRHKEEVENLKSEVRTMQTRAARPGLIHSSKQVLDTLDRKEMDGGYRALLAGDRTKAYEYFMEAKAMSSGTNPDGGYFVDTMFSNILNKVMEEISPMRRLARVIPLDEGTDTYEELTDREQVAAVWVGENTTRPETATGKVNLFSVTVHEIYAMPKVSQKMVDVSEFNLIDWFATKIGESFGAKESEAFHTGDGVAKPRGILTYPTEVTGDATRTWGRVQHILTGQASALGTTQDFLIDVTTALKPQYRTGAVWLMNRTTAGTLRKYKDLEGRYIWTESLIAGQPSVLLGYPVEIDEDMPDVAAGAYPIAFGNFERAYTVVEKPGIKYLPDPYTAKPHVLMYSYRRVGGGVCNTEAFKLVRVSN